MKHGILLLLLCCLQGRLMGQTIDTLPDLSIPDCYVVAPRVTFFNETTLNALPIWVDSLRKMGNYNLTDMLAKVPGVSMLSTGVAIAKPVIRGLYGNRVLVLLSGLKFDNQQWQEEHGLGLSDLGLARVELVKGPMSVIYGSEAIGGLINLVEEYPSGSSKVTDFSMKLHSNTLGGLFQAGFKVDKNNKWFQIRGGVENNADYSDGNGSRVLNSRFDGYYLKSTYGFERGNWISVNHYSGSFNRFGFIFNDIYDFVTPDSRWSRRLNVNPAHLVLLNVFSSENQLRLENGSKLTINAGVQSNERMENEGGGAISLNMHLLTLQYIVKWEHILSYRHKLILSNLGSFEDNTNYGARKIVPDARMQESNTAVYLQSTMRHHVTLENGVSAGEKWIKTFFTPSVNSPEKEIHPFSKFSPYYNFFSGINLNPREKFSLKLNAATGVRIPNLAELSSNGLHEGVFTYEIGSPELKNEQNLAFNLFVEYKTGRLEMFATPFFNRFFQYVYLAPTTEEWFGFPVYRYRQQNARQYGGEAGLTLRPNSYWQIGVTYSGMISKTDDGQYTPFVPARKIASNVHYRFPKTGKTSMKAFLGADYCLAQNKIYPQEIATPSYWLLNAGINGSWWSIGRQIDWALSGNNLLNVAYYDHLSRFKYFGLLNIGRNITLQAKIYLSHT